MRFPLSRQQVRLLFGALTLLSIQGLVTPRPAWAGCSNLVHSHVQNHGALANLDALITGWTAMEIESNPVDDLSTRHKPSRPLPCSGPSCSGRVPFPVAATVVGVVDLLQWGVLPGSFELVPLPGRKEWAVESLADLTSQPSLVFHPPRCHPHLGLSYFGHCRFRGEFESGITHSVLVPRFSFASCEASPEHQVRPIGNHGGPYSGSSDKLGRMIMFPARVRKRVEKRSTSEKRSLRLRRYPRSSCRGARSITGLNDVRPQPLGIAQAF